MKKCTYIQYDEQNKIFSYLDYIHVQACQEDSCELTLMLLTQASSR